MALSIQQKGINFDPMPREEVAQYLMRIYIICFFSFFEFALFAQYSSEKTDLGALNGELKSVNRTLHLKGVDPSAQLSSSNRLLAIDSIAYDSINDAISLEMSLNIDSRIGRFTDTISVVTNDGVVIGNHLLSYLILTPVGDIFKSYRNEFWPFKSKDQVFNLRIGYAGETLDESFDLLNFSGRTLDLSNAMVSENIAVSFQPEEVLHNTFTRMNLRLTGETNAELGFQRKKIPLIVEEDTITYLPIQYSLVPAPTQEGPVLDMTRDELDYKVVKVGEVISDVVLISNEGETTLEIFKVETNCICLNASISKTSIAPKQNVQLRFKFNTTDRLGLQRKQITLFTNDPVAATKSIIVKAHVK